MYQCASVDRPHRRTKQTRVSRENILQLLPDATPPDWDELASYWRRVHKPALTYLARRPLKVVRHVAGQTFYHKGKLPPVPAAVHQLKLKKREGGEGTRVWVDDRHRSRRERDRAIRSQRL